MNAPAKFDHAEARLTRVRADRLAAITECDIAAETLARTEAIVNRLLPYIPAPHGFFDAFDEASVERFRQRRRDRKELNLAIKPRIREKVRANASRLAA